MHVELKRGPVQLRLLFHFIVHAVQIRAPERMLENIKEDKINLFTDVVVSFNPVAEWQKHADRRTSISFNPPWSYILRGLRKETLGNFTQQSGLYLFHQHSYFPGDKHIQNDVWSI